MITREEIRANPDKLYVFGDNFTRRGRGGQAYACRGEPNTVGIRTKYSPSNNPDDFFSDEDLLTNTICIIEDISHALTRARQENLTIVILPGIGTGYADLPRRAPLTFNILQALLNRLSRR